MCRYHCCFGAHHASESQLGPSACKGSDRTIQCADGKDCYGNGEGFVFTFRNSPGEMRDDTVRNKDNFTVVPKEMQVVKIFPSVPNSNRYFMRSTTSDGLFVGGSSGMNCVAAVRAARELGPGHTVVTVLCDGGQRYLNSVHALAEPEAAAEREDGEATVDTQSTGPSHTQGPPSMSQASKPVSAGAGQGQEEASDSAEERLSRLLGVP